MKIVRLLIVLAAAVGALASRADLLRLNDGSALEGVVKRNGDGYDVIDVAGKLSHVAAENVRGIELTAKTGGVGEAESRLTSLRRSLENTTDFKVILDRYARFIELNKDPAVAKEAEKDRAMWHDRIARGMSRLGTKWVTADERLATLEKGMVIADQARQLLKQGRLKEAEPVLNQALEEDPTNISALYLRGWMLYNQEQLQPARKTYEAAVALVKDHAPTLNNLAVVLWRVNAQPQAMNYYEQAMLASPLNRAVLDNVAEALNALPANQRNVPVVQKAARRFTDQDATLQQQLAVQGWYRWGSAWVDRTQLEQFKAAEIEVQKKLDAMNIEFEASKKKIGNIDDDIDDNARRMRSLEATSVGRDAQGNIFRLPLPSRYYDYEADNKKLARERADLVAKMEGLRVEAKRVQQQVPMPKFKGVQRMIGVEGTPALPPTRGPTAAPVDPAPRVAPAPVPPAVPVAPVPAVAPTTRPVVPGAVRPSVPDSLLSQ